MKKQSLGKILCIPVFALAATALTSCNSNPVPEVPQIKKIVNDFEKTPDTFSFHPGEQQGAKCNAKNGIGFKNSRGLHLICPAVVHIAPAAKTFFNAPVLDMSSADGLMFWISTPQAMGFSLCATGKDVQGLYNIGDGVLVMDERCQMLDPKKYLSKANNALRSIALPAGFKGWIIVPSSLSNDGANSGWIHPNASKGKVPQIDSLLIWTRQSEFDIDQLSLYQKTP